MMSTLSVYTDRSPIGEIVRQTKLDENILFHCYIHCHGYMVGGWKRTIKKNEILIELVLFTTLTRAEKGAIIQAAQQYGKFLGLAVELINLG